MVSGSQLPAQGIGVETGLPLLRFRLELGNPSAEEGALGQAQPGCGVSGQGGRIGRAHRPGLCSRPAGRSRPLGGAAAFLRGLREGAWVPSEPLWDTNDAGFPRRDVPIPFICNKRNERNVCRPLMYLSNRKVIPACDGGGAPQRFYGFSVTSSSSQGVTWPRWGGPEGRDGASGLK